MNYKTNTDFQLTNYPHNREGGSTSFFQLGGTDRTNNSIQLKNLPQGLDREDVPEYQLYIDVTNDVATQPPISEMIPRNYTLYVRCWRRGCLLAVLAWKSGTDEYYGFDSAGH